MGDINSYIQEKGNLTFEEWAFNEVDSLILSQLAYLNYADSPASQAAFACMLSKIEENNYNDSFVKHTRVPENNSKLFHAAAQSRRFGSISAGYYVDLIDSDTEKQFSAIAFRLSDNLHYIAYRGTDASFIGWKEDLNLSFLTNIPSQRDAAAYFEMIAQSTEGSYILGGHSKGGNLAVYAAMTAPESLKGRIAAIYNHDGPGFLPEIFTLNAYQTISSRIHKTIPQTAIIGLLLEQHEDYSVVSSNAFMFMQHDPFSWIVEDGAFIHIKEIDQFSKYTNKALNIWLSKIDIDTRKTFVDSLYSIIQNTNANTFPELIEHWQANIKPVLNGIRTTNPEIKKIIYITIVNLIKASMSEMKDLLIG